ncbi:PREDICTED: protein takeout-like [Nicrophorus vespilloides]|uniref:Protein takeout-like n=1 Tax=Nicrophorus vespilloides TaxID=110193 RepID=A0ABM1N2D5_NICVS|nr:PREDICTED: protein takeout-like [Nicrophorus vespilloides]
MIKLIFEIVLLVNVIDCYQKRDAPVLTTQPSWVPTCKRNGPDTNKCFLKLFTSLIQQTIKGNPELNIDPIEPLFIENLPINKKNGAVRLTGFLRNYTMEGMGATKILDAQMNFDKRIFSVNMYMPQMKAYGVYDFKGQVLILPIAGNGNSFLDIKGSTNKLQMKFDLVNVHGVEVMRVNKIQRFDLDRDDVKIRLDNLFNGNKLLGDNANKFINDNGKNLAKQVEGVITENLEPIILDIINNIVEKIPISMSFPN